MSDERQWNVVLFESCKDGTEGLSWELGQAKLHGLGSARVQLPEATCMKGLKRPSRL